ncbi:hypothetical protein HD806DRAFT_512620 [Xylariaceae sp. AK1471]|nr:hypothetical protein HD806DRAFT_512620 [Xylariaceae sp. AK1471]
MLPDSYPSRVEVRFVLGTLFPAYHLNSEQWYLYFRDKYCNSSMLPLSGMRRNLGLKLRVDRNFTTKLEGCPAKLCRYAVVIYRCELASERWTRAILKSALTGGGRYF